MPNTYIAHEDIKEGDAVEIIDQRVHKYVALPHVVFSKNPYGGGGVEIKVGGYRGRVLAASTEGTAYPSEGDVVIFIPFANKIAAEAAARRLAGCGDYRC